MKDYFKWTYCFVISIFTIACNNNTGENNGQIATTHYHIFIDITDSTNRNINLPVDELLNYAGLNTKEGGRNGIKSNIYTINNLSSSKSFKITPLPIEDAFGNPLTRIKLIKKFANELSSSFNKSIESTNWQKNESRIYTNLCNKFVSIAREMAINEKEVIIIYSDMLENSNLFSFYKSSDKSRINNWIKDINKAEIELSKSSDCSFPDLSNIEIYIVAERKDSNNTLIDFSQSFWKRFFEYKKCKKIKFDADLSLEP